MPLVLSLFPGADLLGMAFEMEGFCIVHGPEILIGKDIKNWHCPPGHFDGVIGGPPCQAFSRARMANRNSEEIGENLIPEFERIINEAQPSWWLSENVPDAPIPKPDWKRSVWNAILNAADFGSEQSRRRRFSSTFALAPMPMARVEDPWPTVTATENRVSSVHVAVENRGAGYKARAALRKGCRLTLSEINVLMGLPHDWETPALTIDACYKVRGNGVPIPMGRALARALKAHLE